MPDPKIQLVCFDLGGVLVRLCKNLTDACSRAEVHITPDIERAWSNHLPLLQQLESGALSESDYENGLPRCLPHLTLDQIRRAFDAYLLGLFPGAPELLADLHSRRIPMAILSNTNPRHLRAVLEQPRYTPLKLIPNLFASCQIRFAKPDPRAYEHVQNSLRIPSHSILYFDDLPANIHAAQSLTWNAHLIDPASDPIAQQRHILRLQNVL